MLILDGSPSAVAERQRHEGLVEVGVTDTGLLEREVASMMTTARGRRELSIHSLPFFDAYYCGMIVAPFRERWLNAFQDSIEEAEATSSKGRLLLLAPRDHGKSESVISLITWTICRDRTKRVLLLSENGEQSASRMGRALELLDDPRIVADWTSAPEEGFGPFRAPSRTGARKWSNNTIYVNSTSRHIDPTLKAVGYGSAVTGAHPDLIVYDDIESAKNAASPTERDRLKRFHDETVSPMLSRKGFHLVVGTHKHADDLYAYLKSKPTWNVICDSAIVREPDHWEPETVYDPEQDKNVLVGLKIKGEENAEVLWPPRFPGDFPCRDLRYLLGERVDVGERAFAREYQNQIVGDAGAPVALVHLEKSVERGIALSMEHMPPPAFFEDKVVLQAWDFSLIDDPKKAEDRDGDYTVGVTLAKCLKTGQRYLLDMYRERGLTDLQIQNAIIEFYEMWGGAEENLVQMVVVERNSFGQLHFKQLRRSTDLPLKPHYTGRNKTDPWEGVPGLALQFENGKWTLASADEHSRYLSRKVFVAEFYGLGKAKHDDTVMAIWIGESRLSKLGRRHRVGDGDAALARHGEKRHQARQQLREQARILAREAQDALPSTLAHTNSPPGQQTLDVEPEQEDRPLSKEEMRARKRAERAKKKQNPVGKKESKTTSPTKSAERMQADALWSKFGNLLGPR